MLSVEQVRALEERVGKAVSYIESLKTENAELRKELERTAAELGASKARNAELEAAAQSFKSDQARIEAGIVHALEKLDIFEDLVLQAGTAGRGASPQPEPQAEAPAPRADARADARAEARAATPEPRPVAPSAAAPKATADEMSEAELEAATAPAGQEAEAVAEAELDIF